MSACGQGRPRVNFPLLSHSSPTVVHIILNYDCFSPFDTVEAINVHGGDYHTHNSVYRLLYHRLAEITMKSLRISVNATAG